MQQLTIEHKNTRTNQVVKTTVKMKNRREGKGRVLAISQMVYRLQNTDIFYVESETRDNHYYFVKYNPSSVVESRYCNCKDNTTRGLKCKHIFAIEFAIKWGTIKDIDKVPSPLLEANKRYLAVVQPSNNNKKSYLEDEYDF
jgi:predicted nucleic acid-binding Zn finger protein